MLESQGCLLCGKPEDGLSNREGVVITGTDTSPIGIEEAQEGGETEKNMDVRGREHDIPVSSPPDRAGQLALF